MTHLELVKGDGGVETARGEAIGHASAKRDRSAVWREQLSDGGQVLNGPLSESFRSFRVVFLAEAGVDERVEGDSKGRGVVVVRFGDTVNAIGREALGVGQLRTGRAEKVLTCSP